MSELKPCPFCGGKASIYESNRYPSSGNRITGYTVICTDMDCINYRADDWYERTEKRAIERWNTRVERTCHPVEQLPPSESLSTPVRLSCGHVVEGVLDGEASMLPNFCEVCGAKVVEP